MTLKSITTKFLLFAAISAMCTLFVPMAHAQVSVEVGPAPVCPYGYYDVPPYSCAPYGYYGPEWFVNGVFIGAGPWYHGPEHFYGHVNNRFHPDHGYRGPMPQRGERASRPVNHIQNFKGNEMRDGRGHVRGGHEKK